MAHRKGSRIVRSKHRDQSSRRKIILQGKGHLNSDFKKSVCLHITCLDSLSILSSPLPVPLDPLLAGSSVSSSRPLIAWSLLVALGHPGFLREMSCLCVSLSVSSFQVPWASLPKSRAGGPNSASLSFPSIWPKWNGVNCVRLLLTVATTVLEDDPLSHLGLQVLTPLFLQAHSQPSSHFPF